MVKFFISIYGGILFIFLNYLFLQLLLGLFSFHHDYPLIKKQLTAKQIDPELFYFIIIPCCNEEAVIARTLTQLCQLDFQGKIIAIDDGSTDQTAQQIQTVNNDKIHYLKRVLPNAQTGKGEALNHALKICEQIIQQKHLNPNKVIIGVVDADGALSKNSFNVLNHYFSNPKTIAAQLRVKMYPQFENTLQISQDAEFFTIINLLQNMRMYTRTVGLSGNGQFFRLQPIVEKIGHQPWGNALLDDYELTLKLMLQKIPIDYISHAWVYQQSLKNMRAYIRQRSRWAQGDLDCLKYLKPVLQSSALDFWQKGGILLFFIQPWLNFMADIAVFGLFLLTVKQVIFILIARHFNLTIINKLVINIVVLFVSSSSWGVLFTFLYHYDLKHNHEARPSKKYLLRLPILIAYMYLILFFSISIAFWRHLRHKSSWIKTKHE